ncbi:MAG: hypothetical protein J0M35_04910 [Candidatus Obscuribacter phosphatis]|uniref:Uncharacterized protein n=1 Tax=Candidatus Obscuribacter phosphatis TaxID=1906157 RepID=A0A8J7TKM9_9BACT|nr:hypothetical protein [Candidatus Obscuribacter phosphatis]
MSRAELSRADLSRINQCPIFATYLLKSKNVDCSKGSLLSLPAPFCTEKIQKKRSLPRV